MSDQKTTFRIPEQLHKKAKIRSIETGETMAEMINRLLEKELSKTSTKQKVSPK